MIDNTAVALLTLSLTLLVHLVTTVWWAASITRRIEFIEKMDFIQRTHGRKAGGA